MASDWSMTRLLLVNELQCPIEKVYGKVVVEYFHALANTAEISVRLDREVKPANWLLRAFSDFASSLKAVSTLPSWSLIGQDRSRDKNTDL